MPPVKKDTPVEPAKQKSVYETLSQIDVNEHTEKKNGLTYLSWAWAWGILKKYYPESYFIVYHNDQGWNYFTDGKTCWVKTGVTVVDGDFVQEYIEELPVMDFKNNSIPLEQIQSTHVNKAIQRSMTKAIARHGLGLYIYAGEDIPDENDETKQQKAAEAQQKAAVAEAIAKLDKKIKVIIHPMSPDEKKKFAAEKVAPVLGTINYLKCDDLDKINKLLSDLDAA